MGEQQDPPRLSADMKDPSNMEEWVKLFRSLDLALLTGNLVADLIDPDTMACYRELKDKLSSWKLDNGPGEFMGLHSSTWANIAVHANQAPLSAHKDALSSHKGMDQIFPFGPFRRCCLAVPHLGVRVRLEPLDFCIIRGAALWHHMYTWQGLGRFVVVPFADRHLFPVVRVGRPNNPIPFLGRFWTELRKRHPAAPLPTFAK